MMHGHGKSDRPIVPAKSPNNAGPPVAEGMEGRGLAKGNPSQQNLPIGHSAAPGRPSALERVRQAAQRERTIRFTALLHHIYALDRLRAAYLSLKRHAAPGVDGETWRHYGEALEERVSGIPLLVLPPALHLPFSILHPLPFGLFGDSVANGLEGNVAERAAVGTDGLLMLFGLKGLPAGWIGSGVGIVRIRAQIDQAYRS
jgi:hypothetical protein